MVSHKRNLDKTQRWKECNKHYSLKGARGHCSSNILVLIIWFNLGVQSGSIHACNWILIMLNFIWVFCSWKTEKYFSPYTHTPFCITGNKLTAKNQSSSYGLDKTYRYSSYLPMARPDTNPWVINDYRNYFSPLIDNNKMLVNQTLTFSWPKFGEHKIPLEQPLLRISWPWSKTFSDLLSATLSFHLPTPFPF